MEERPLFGAGSKSSKRSQNQVAFLRPAATTNGRLNVNTQALTEPAPVIPSTPVNGTKDMRQTPPQIAQTVPIQQPVHRAVPQALQPQAIQPQALQPQALQPQVMPPQAMPPAMPAVAPVVAPVAPQYVQPVAQPPAQQQVQIPQAAVPPQPHLVPGVPVTPATSPAAPVQQAPPPQTGSEEDRTEKRHRTLKGGMVVLPGQMMSSYACKIRNESRGGVMLLLADAMLVPPEFYLIRDADPGHKIPCRIAWRGIGRIGVQFIAQLSSP